MSSKANASRDIRILFLVIAKTFPNGQMRQSQLFTCWRPATETQNLWSDQRVTDVLEGLLVLGYVERRLHHDGTYLHATELGKSVYSTELREAST